ncbi:MAG: pre-peptidase C-terminal domain-containing protein [Albidovulum sp.]|nr:pre-peptidase C-terminal domain-containing protein [Albidovulum sp.]
MLRTASLLLAALSFQCLAGLVLAQDCRPFRLTGEALQRWYNPHPSRDDFLLPMPLGMSLVFTPVPLGTEGLYGDERSTYIMGSRTPRLFETNLEVRVGSSIAGGGEARFLFGKYEVSKAQFVSVMGRGNLELGAKILSERTRDPRGRQTLESFIGGPCEGTLTREVYDYLSEPLTFLSYRDFIDFLDEYNLYCISRNDCRRILSRLGNSREVPGFVRLPAEHEWEFVARGGGKYVAGEITKAEFQADLPRVAPGTTILRHAHVGSDPPRPLPIGSREPLFGIFDMLGNAQELMLNPFTAENGYGAVGGYVARGGHYRLKPEELRISRRVELQAFRFDEDRDSIVIQFFPLTGIRLVVGYPVFGAAQRVGDDSLQRDFLENYVPPSEAGDIAGNTVASARDLGAIGDEATTAREELSKEDSVDYYKIVLREYSKLSVALFSDASIQFEIVDELQEVVNSGTSDGRRRISNPLLPGIYWVKLSPTGIPNKEQRYRIEISRAVNPDTGIARPDPSALPGSASSLRTSLSFSGYVGPEDTVDTYPIKDISTAGGLELRIREASAPVTLTYLDEKLNSVRQMEFNQANENRRLVLNSSMGRTGFVQVSSAPNFATTYTLTVEAKAPYNRTLLKSPGTAHSGPFGSENVTYEGNLDASLPRLYLPIKLEEARMLKLELTGLSADVDLKVIGADGRNIPSNHVRGGTAPEFFSELVSAGLYYAEVGLKSSRNLSGFKLLLSTGDVPTQTVAANLANERLLARSLGIVEGSGKSVDSVIYRETVYYRFSVQADEQLLAIELSEFSVLADLDIFLEDSTGNVLASSAGTDTTESIEYLAVAGTYFLRIKRSGFGGLSTFPSTFRLSVTSAQKMQPPNLSSLGSMVYDIDDFEIYWDAVQDTCSMVTIAKRVVPNLGWRRSTPFFYITVKKGSDSIWIGIDFADAAHEPDEIYRNASVAIKVMGKSGSILGRLPAAWDGKTLLPSDDGGLTISGETIPNFVKGTMLQLAGRTPAGSPAIVEYSLLGYRDAAFFINTLCSADANWIWDE